MVGRKKTVVWAITKGNGGEVRGSECSAEGVAVQEGAWVEGRSGGLGGKSG